MISRFCSNALEIHKLKNIAPNLLQQMLLCFLVLDLQFKNIACQICDTFI
jgi:hypothetical protein